MLLKNSGVKLSQIPILGIWWLEKKFFYSFWNAFHRLSGPMKFSYIGKNVKFNGRVRVEHPYSNISIGDECMIGKGCYFLAKPGKGSISLGNNVGINDYCFITSCFSIEIGNNVRIAELVSIRDYNHEFEDVNVPIRLQGVRGDNIKIGDDVWIGRGVMITPGISIGKGSIIGANSVVTKSLPEMCVAVGAPAKVIRFR